MNKTPEWDHTELFHTTVPTNTHCLVRKTQSSDITLAEKPRDINACRDLRIGVGLTSFHNDPQY